MPGTLHVFHSVSTVAHEIVYLPFYRVRKKPEFRDIKLLAPNATVSTWQSDNLNPDLINSSVDLVFQEPPNRVQLDVILKDVLTEKSR